MSLSPKQLMELDGCTRCGQCTLMCEAYSHTEGEPESPSYRIRKAYEYYYYRRRSSWLSRMISGRKAPDAEELKTIAEGSFKCTLCARCKPVCPAGIDLVSLWKSLRVEWVEHGLHPSGLDLAKDAVVNEKNITNYPNEDRALWVDFLDEARDDGYIKDKAQVLYYVGCMSSFSPAAQPLPEAFVQILDHAGVDFSILGKDEWCCGFPLIAGGMPSYKNELIRHNVSKAKELGASTVVFTCPSCFFTWRNYYQPLLPDVKMYHATQFLDMLIETGRLKFEKTDLTVSYHDPCDLARSSGVFKAPRSVISRMPGVKLVEGKYNRVSAHCCGGGGDLEISDQDLAKSISITTATAFKNTGADQLITACPQCLRMLSPAGKEVGIEAKDISTLVLELLAK